VAILKPGIREQSTKQQTVLNDSKTMNTKMYVGNLSFDTTESDLRAACEQHGAVTELSLPMDRGTGRPRGFAFVTMETAEGMNAAIAHLNGKPLGGRLLTVNEARPREDRPAYSGGGGGGGYGGGGGGGGGRGGKRDRY
jgi:cold-inducible RNA-binding protein